MILVDVNVLLYAANPHYPEHLRAKEWWESRLNGEERVALSWQTLSGFIRIGTNPRIFERPLSREAAVQFVDEWLAAAPLCVVEPAPQHWRTFRRLLLASGSDPDLVTDAYLAALAIDHDCELNSTDEDFRGFAGLRWRNPLTGAASPTI